MDKKEQICRICGNKSMADTYIVREMLNGTREEFEYFRCDHCDCLQITSIPEDVSKYYDNASYYSFQAPDGIKKENVPQLDEEVQKKRYLDVGCGAGNWLCDMADRGCVSLTGCDPFIEKELHYPNGVTIYKKTIHEMEGEFDQITLFDSFEHMADPIEVLKSAKRLLAPDGLLGIRIPIIPNIAFKKYGENWFQIDAPRHFYIHSLKSMEYMVEQTGWKMVQVDYDSGSDQFIRSILYANDIPYCIQTTGLIDTVFTKEQQDMYEELSRQANEQHVGDHAIITLRHAEEV